MQKIFSFVGAVVVLTVLGEAHEYSVGQIYDVPSSTKSQEILYFKEVLINYMNRAETNPCEFQNHFGNWRIREQVVQGALYYFSWELVQQVKCNGSNRVPG